jgi:DNA repair exonuclease SbcCD nuclease subunit
MPELIVGHAHVTGAKNTSDIEIEAGDALHFDPTEYPRCLCVFGHIHQHQVLKNRIVYVGPVVTNSFDEAELVKGFVWVRRDLKWEFIPYTTPETEYRHVTIDLVSKDTLSLDPKKVREVATDRLLKLTVYAKDHMQVNKQEITKVFDEYGQVVRFETVICNEMGKVDDDVAAEFSEQIEYGPVLKAYLESKDMSKGERNLAIELGNDVIAEVINASRA